MTRSFLLFLSLLHVIFIRWPVSLRIERQLFREILTLTQNRFYYDNLKGFCFNLCPPSPLLTLFSQINCRVRISSSTFQKDSLIIGKALYAFNSVGPFDCPV